MFGLMKNTGCLDAPQENLHRIHYCGLCKSIGSKYGQKSRLFLNHDAVFLAEILSHLSGTNTDDWDESLLGYRCLNLPDVEKIPVPLDYAADFNLILANIRIKDNQTDDLKIIWSSIANIYQVQINKISSYLQKWNLDEEKIYSFVNQNQKNEISQMPLSFAKTRNVLQYYAAPTANFTGYLFSKGAEAIDRVEYKNMLYDLGFHFGELIYCLDAVTDIQEDIENGNFNPIQEYFIHSNAGLDKEVILKKAKEYLWELASDIFRLIQDLPFDEATKNSMQQRLESNLIETLDGNLAKEKPVYSGKIKSTVPRVRRHIKQVFEFLNPAIPGKFAISYFLFLCLFFSQKLLASVDLIIKPIANNSDWTFIASIIAFPILAYLFFKSIKRNNILEWLKKQQENLKKKIKAHQNKKALKWWAGLLIFIGALLLIFIVVAIISLANFSLDTSGCKGF